MLDFGRGAHGFGQVARGTIVVDAILHPVLANRQANVLLVEDEPLISDVAAEALEEQGFVVATASNATDALRRLQAGSAVDILFTDINLPGGMDGATLARRARELRPDL